MRSYLGLLERGSSAAGTVCHCALRAGRPLYFLGGGRGVWWCSAVQRMYAGAGQQG